MNRLTPLIVRQSRPQPARPFREWEQEAEPAAPDLTSDLRLFLTFWAGGLVFFGTLFS